MKKYITLLLAVLTLMASCNKDDVITGDPEVNLPTIELDSETGIYVTKIGREITIAPTYTNDEGASFAWTLENGEKIGEGPSLVYTFAEKGDYYITITVTNDDGSADDELMVSVADLAPPVISIAVPPGGLEVLAGRVYKFTPDVQNGEGATFLWTVDGKEAGEAKDYEFREDRTGEYSVKLRVENEDGEAEKEVAVTVVDALPVRVYMPRASMYAAENTVTVFRGRMLYIDPYVENAVNPAYRWEVDGQVQEANGSVFRFTPAEADRTYEVRLVVTDGAGPHRAISRNVTDTGIGQAELTIEVKSYGDEDSRKRTGSEATWEKVYEYMPAPGQFINELATGGFAGEASHEAALAYAERRLTEGNLVSLGAYGGYITVGFDHSIESGADGYDFSIAGNQFAGSSEPGIVWVMQDANGNGKPDDVWYELEGSEWGDSRELQKYAVTYYRPAGAGMNVQWTDNRGASGVVDHLPKYHNQDYYYPLWVEGDAYTLYGSGLHSRISQDPVTSDWIFGDYGWGYADNFGSDNVAGDGNRDAKASKVYFKISSAVYPDGTPANLKYADFVKVQTAVLGKGGRIGEVSTEVAGFADENMNREK